MSRSPRLKPSPLRCLLAATLAFCVGTPPAPLRADEPARPPARSPKPAKSPDAATSSAPAKPEQPSAGNEGFSATPGDAQDLLALEQKVKEVIATRSACTVELEIGGGRGSGVIVSKDGLVLTAGHVVREPKLDCWVVLPDGKRVRGKTLGVHELLDCGMVRITADERREWPFAPLGKSGALGRGEWCVALGHPGGFQAKRGLVARLGRMLFSSRTTLRSDATLVGGDSGGPLFDLAGRVVGIHSSIGGPITANLHVPIDAFIEHWDALAKGEHLARKVGVPGGPFLGLGGGEHPKGILVTEVMPKQPADKAGLEVGDIVTHFDGAPLAEFIQLVEKLSAKKPGDKIKLRVVRDEKQIELVVEVGKRPSVDPPKQAPKPEGP